MHANDCVCETEMKLDAFPKLTNGLSNGIPTVSIQNFEKYMSRDRFRNSVTVLSRDTNSQFVFPMPNDRCKAKPGTENDINFHPSNHLHLVEDSNNNGSSSLTVPVTRSTSMKIRKHSTGERPEQSPSEKKMVRFADALGLDLVDVRIFKKGDNMPSVPKSAFADLKITPPKNYFENVLKRREKRILEPSFPQPGSDPRFFHRVKEQKVCLENILTDGVKLTGIIRVLNLSFVKFVYLRYTVNNWTSYSELQATFLNSASFDGSMDLFKFEYDASDIYPGDKFIFVIRYETNGEVFWDNNNGSNYEILCTV